MSEQKTYEEIMIEISQSDSNKKHCMEYAVDYAEKADNEIATLKAQRDELLAEVEEWRAIKAAYLIEYAAMPSHSRPGQYHGHAHDIDGIWDSDNRMFAGCKCAACMMHRAAIANAEKDKP